MGSSADAGRAAAAAASSFGVGIGGDTAGDIPGDGGPSSCSSRRRRPSPPQPPAAAAAAAGRGALGAAPGAHGDTQRWELRRVVDVYPRQPAPGLGRRGSPSPRAMAARPPRALEPGRRRRRLRRGLGCRRRWGVSRARRRRGCRRRLRRRLRRSKAQRRLALAPHRLEQRVRELTARVEPRGGDRPRWGAAAAARVNTAAVGEPRDDLVDRGIVRLRRSREWGAVVRVMVGRRTRERRSFVARGGSTHLGRAAELGRRALGWIERVAYLQYRVHGARSGSTPASEADPVARAERSGPAPDEVISNVERSVVFNKGY